MTQAGFAGNLRYVALPAALVCVLAGAGWVELVRADEPRASGAIAAGALALARGRARSCRSCSTTSTGSTTTAQLIQDGGRRSTARSRTAIAKAGGRERRSSLRHGVHRPVPDVQAIAWHLHLHSEQIEIFAVRRPAPLIAPPYPLAGASTRASPRSRRHAAVGRSARLPAEPLVTCKRMATYASRPAWELRATGGQRARASSCPLGLGAPASPSRCCCARASSTSASGSTRACRSGSPTARSPTSRACCARTARRRSTTCCCTSGSRVFGRGESRACARCRCCSRWPACRSRGGAGACCSARARRGSRPSWPRSTRS